MGRSFVGTLLLLTMLCTAPLAMACEKHINGHQNSSDTNAEGVQK
jgi:hypothetical protein